MYTTDELRKKVKRAIIHFTDRNTSVPCTAGDLEDATEKLANAMLAIIDKIESMEKE